MIISTSKNKPCFSVFLGGYFEKIPRGVGGGGITLGKKVNRK